MYRVLPDTLAVLLYAIVEHTSKGSEKIYQRIYAERVQAYGVERWFAESKTRSQVALSWPCDARPQWACWQRSWPTCRRSERRQRSASSRSSRRCVSCCNSDGALIERLQGCGPSACARQGDGSGGEARLWRATGYAVIDICFALSTAVIAKSGDDVVRAFLLACETKNTKVAGPAIASLQKIASQNALPRVRRTHLNQH